MKRILLTVAVAAMLVLAGCNGGGQGTVSPTETDGTPTDGELTSGTPTDGEPTSGTPTDETDEDSSLPSPSVPESLDIAVSPVGPGNGSIDAVSSDTYPAGVDSSGVTNASALVNSHFEAAGSNAETRMALSSGGGTLGLVHKNGSDGERLRYVNTTTERSETYWRSGSTVVRQNASMSPPVTYSHGRTNTYTGYQVLGLFRLYPFLTLNTMSMSVDGTTTVDGDEVLRLSIDSINRSSDMLSIGAGLENARGYALVTSEGVIRELHWKATNSTTGATESMTVTVSGVGETSVERPDWTTGYPDATVSTTSEGQVLTLTHQGGATIEAGTRIKLGTRRLPYGNVTLPESLESGETLYVVASGQFGNYNFTASVGSQPPVSENATSFSRLPPVSVSLDGATLRYGPEVGARAGTSSGFGAGA